ncbi:MAG: diguanylate cyclase [Eubacteriales bacterium]
MDYEPLILDLTEKAGLLSSIYEYIRLVDPVQKTVIHNLKTDAVRDHDNRSKCYSAWGKNAVCANCISMRATNQKRTCFKIEYKDSRVYLLTSTLVDYGDIGVVVEMFKDITKDGIIDVDNLEIGEIHSLVDRQNSRIIRDAFTRFYNETYIFEKLPHDISKCNEENRRLALFYLNINNFPVINHLFGYRAGDYVIKEFAKLIKKYCRKNGDWTARYSGAKFILVMFDVDEKQAYRICKHMNDKINKHEFCFEGKLINLEAGIGLHVLNNEIMPAEQLIEAASRALHTGGREENGEPGRNREGLLQKYLLTQREKEVALLLLQGRSNSKIARDLFISISTVKKHIASIFEKTNVESRSEFISKF